jgi:two-component system sensor histidine kinase QseC
MQAQVALGATADAERRHALLQTLEGCDRATRVVEQLLTLTRLEATAAQADDRMNRVDLGALAQRVAADLAPQALAKQQALELEAAAGVAVRGDTTLLGVLLRNLLDNAVRYSPVGGRIQVRVEHMEGGVRLGVEDSGPGLADADLARLGERFFRVLGTGEDGSGLGWSIVRRIAAAHGAQVTAQRSATLGGLAVEVSWPAAA